MMRWLLGWLLMFMLLYVLSKTRSGHTIIYWTAWLLVLLLIVSHADEINTMLSGVFQS